MRLNSAQNKNPPPTGHLYHNNHDGTFTDVTRSAGLTASGWGQGACVGDYDNDGFDDLYVTYYGKNRLYHNEGNGTFKEVAAEAGSPEAGASGARAAPSSTMTATANSTWWSQTMFTST